MNGTFRIIEEQKKVTAKSDGIPLKCRQNLPPNSKKWRQKMPSFAKSRKLWRQKVPSNPKSGGKKCRHVSKVTAKSAVISHYQGFQGLLPWPEAFWRWRHKCVSGKRLRIYEENPSVSATQFCVLPGIKKSPTPFYNHFIPQTKINKRTGKPTPRLSYK